MRRNPPHLGSLGSAIHKVSDQILPPLQLKFGTPARQNGPQSALTERVDFQRCHWMEQAILNLIRQLEQIQDLCDPSPRKALSGGDFRLGEPGVALYFVVPETGLLKWVYADRFDIARVARF